MIDIVLAAETMKYMLINGIETADANVLENIFDIQVLKEGVNNLSAQEYKEKIIEKYSNSGTLMYNIGSNIQIDYASSEDVPIMTPSY